MMLARDPSNSLGSSRDIAREQRPAGASLTSQLLFVAGLVALIFLAGCEGETQVPVFPVTGSVTAFQGEIPVGANVTLSATTPVPDDVAPSGKVETDGTFKIGTYALADGAPAGDYVVTFTWFKFEDQARGSNVLPAKFSSAETSPIKVSVNGATDVPPISFTE